MEFRAILTSETHHRIYFVEMFPGPVFHARPGSTLLSLSLRGDITILEGCGYQQKGLGGKEPEIWEWPQEHPVHSFDFLLHKSRIHYLRRAGLYLAGEGGVGGEDDQGGNIYIVENQVKIPTYIHFGPHRGRLSLPGTSP